jgi:hypothetical protein
MVKVRGREAFYAAFDRLPAEIEEKLLRGAARAGANVLAADVKENAPADEVRDAVKVRTRSTPERISGTVGIVGAWPRSLAIWAELGTDPHYITVDDSQRGGRSVRKVNELAKGGTLVINGQAVGTTVFHPGARAKPFMRVALDMKGAAAIAAAQAYINARITPGGIVGSADTEDDA